MEPKVSLEFQDLVRVNDDDNAPGVSEVESPFLDDQPEFALDKALGITSPFLKASQFVPAGRSDELHKRAGQDPRCVRIEKTNGVVAEFDAAGVCVKTYLADEV